MAIKGVLDVAHMLGRQFYSMNVSVDGTSYDEHKIVSISIDANASVGKSLMQEAVIEIQVENGSASMANSLKNKTMTASVTLWDGKSNATLATRSFGTFYIYDAKYSNEYRSITITAYDAMLKTMVQVPLGFDPTGWTVKDALQNIATQCGLSYTIPSSFTNSTATLGFLTSASQYSYRDIIDDIAEITGSIIAIKSAKLTLFYPSVPSDGGTSYTPIIEPSNYLQMDVDAQYRVGRVTFARHYSDALSECVYYPTGTVSEEEVRYTNNIVFQGMDAASQGTVASNLYSRLHTTMSSFYPFSCTSCGEIGLEIGDKIKVQDLDGNQFNSIVTNDHIVITDGVSETIGCAMPTDTEEAYRQSSDDAYYSSWQHGNSYFTLEKEDMYSSDSSMTLTAYNAVSGVGLKLNGVGLEIYAYPDPTDPYNGVWAKWRIEDTLWSGTCGERGTLTTSADVPNNLEVYVDTNFGKNIRCNVYYDSNNNGCISGFIPKVKSGTAWYNLYITLESSASKTSWTNNSTYEKFTSVTAAPSSRGSSSLEIYKITTVGYDVMFRG